MPLIGLWALAVYAGSAALVLAAAHRWVLPLRPRTMLILAAAPLLFTGRATITGGVYAPLDILYVNEPFASLSGPNPPPVRTPQLSDVVCSMIPWHRAVRDALLHGRPPLWNPFLLAGEPLLATQQAAPLHPATWIGLLLPLPQAWTLQMSLRLLVALVSAFLLARDLGCGDGASLVGAAAWAFSDFMVFWLGFSVANAIGPLPLLALGLSRLARDADRRAALLTAGALVLVVLGGHPEMLLFAVTAGGVWFLFRLRAAPRERRLRAVGMSFAAGGLAIGLTAVQLLPLAEALPQTWEQVYRSAVWAHTPKSSAPGTSLRRAALFAVPFAYGVSGKSRFFEGFGVPAAYAGSLLFPLAWTGLFARGRPRGALVAIGLLGAAVWMRLIGVTDLLGRLPLFDVGVLDYLVFAAVFALAVLAAFGADRLGRGEGAVAFLCGAALAGIVIAGVFLYRRSGMEGLGLTPAYLRDRLAWQLGPLLAGGAAVGLLIRRSPRLALGAVVAAFTVSRLAEAGSVYPTLPSSDFYPRVPALEAIPRGGPDRIVAVGPILIPNAATLYGLEDVRGYESMTFRPLYETYSFWCRPLGPWFNIVEDLRAPFLSFLNVRYALAPHGAAPPPGWRVRTRSAGADLFENPGALARAFVPVMLTSVPDRLARLEALKGISDFAERGVLAEPGSPAGWIRNGEARATVERYGPQSLSLAVDARETAVVGTSVTAWRGWKARLDGRDTEPLLYNHAFLGFRVPPGRHRIELRYLPGSFRAGLIVSLLTLTGAALWLRRPPRAAPGISP